VSEQTITSPSQPQVRDHEAHGSERPRRRTAGEIEDSLTAMLRGEYAEPQEEEQHSDSGLEDGIEEDGIEAESYEDSEEVDGDYDGSDEEQLESDSASYRVIVDGKEMQVPLDELISGYQRGSSFTQKSQSLADERREFEANAVAVQQERESYSTVLQQLQQQMEAAAKPNLDWDRLERENPVQWLKLKQLERDRQGQIQAVREEQSRMQQVLNQQQEQDLENRLNTERTLVLERIPEWADSEVQANEQRQLLEYGKQLGFTDSELNEIYDHRALIALRDAWRYNQLANGEKVKSAKSKIKNAKSGGKQMSRQMRGRKAKAQRARLKETGKVDDAAALLGAMLTE
jgi:hypothetical protein